MMDRFKWPALGLLVSLMLPVAGWASDTYSIDGYYKNFFVAYDIPARYSAFYGSDAPLGSVSSRLRLNGTWWFNDRTHLRLSYDFAPRVQDHLLFVRPPTTAIIDPSSYRIVDFDSRLYPTESDDVASFAVFHNLDRAFVTLEMERFDLYLGRQPIAFGSARVVNPTDVIAPYTYETLDTEDRIGVDAVRARIPTGFMGEIDAGYVFGDDFEFEKSAFFLRAKLYAMKTDVSLIALGFRENLLVGIDLARSIGGAGFWLEAAQVFSDALSGDSDPGSRDYFRGSLGFDYSYENNTYVFVEYHFNQAGKDDPAEYQDSYSEGAYTKGSVYLLGRHYLTPGITWEFTPLIYGSMQLLTNLSDQSIYVTPSLEYNVAENIYLSGGAFIGLGDSPDWMTDMDSEFGSYPDIFFTSFRLYF